MDNIIKIFRWAGRGRYWVTMLAPNGLPMDNIIKIIMLMFCGFSFTNAYIASIKGILKAKLQGILKAILKGIRKAIVKAILKGMLQEN